MVRFWCGIWQHPEHGGASALLSASRHWPRRVETSTNASL
jgi:hypothetical protein